MGGRHPITIITDQDLAMKRAIAKIFPNTHHRLCLWHIKKFAEKLSHVYFKKSKFKIEMKKCTRKTYKIDDFEVKWKALMKEYGLENDEWLKSLYEIRSSWVPVYNRRIFFAGMNITGRREGINSFFDGFVTPTTNLREFVVKYEQALKKIMERESDEDFETEHKYCIVNEGEFLLQHVASLYTRNVFNKFKDEWSKVNRYKVEEMPRNNEYHAYVVKSKLGEQEEFVVKLNVPWKRYGGDGNFQSSWDFASYSEIVSQEHAHGSTTSVNFKFKKALQQQPISHRNTADEDNESNKQVTS